jgi:subtilisin family serine protease
MVFSRDTAVIPAGGAAIISDLVVDLTDTQRMDGMVRARTPANFETVALRVARERLIVHRQGDRIEVVNGLGDTVNALTVNSGSVHYRLAAPLGNGRRGALVKAAVVDTPVGSGHPYFARFASMIDRSTSPGQLPDESYVAVMARSPFWAPGVESVSERDSVHVVVGTLER